MTEHKHAAVLRAIADGKEVQYLTHDGYGDVWLTGDAFNNPINLSHHEWRIKPEPRTPRRIWVNKYDGMAHTYLNGVYPDRESADNEAGSNRIDCIEFVEVLTDE